MRNAAWLSRKDQGRNTSEQDGCGDAFSDRAKRVSQLTWQAFCAKYYLSVGVFRYWYKKLSNLPGKTSSFFKELEVQLLRIRVEPFDERIVDLCWGDLFRQAVHIEVHGVVSHRTGLFANGRGEEGCPTADGWGNKDAFSAVNEGTVYQLYDLRFCQFAPLVIRDFLESGM